MVKCAIFICNLFHILKDWGIEFLQQTLMLYATQFHRPYIFQTKNSVRTDNLSLKYQMFTSSGFKELRIWKLEFVAKTLFLCNQSLIYISCFYIIISYELKLTPQYPNVQKKDFFFYQDQDLRGKGNLVFCTLAL